MGPKLLDHDPTIVPTNTTPTATDGTLPLLPWIKPEAKVTLYISKIMSKPKQGILKYAKDTDIWTFSPGKKDSHPRMQLPNFTMLAQSMVTNKKLFNGWKTMKHVLTARYLRATSNLLAKHVSATGLNVLQAPSLLRHHKLNPNDRKLWDAAYKEEYDGLTALETWEVIPEEEYIRLKHVTEAALPTMAISTIKNDETASQNDANTE